SVSYNHLIFPGTHDLGIGGTVGGAPIGQVGYVFPGRIDEPTLYARPLSGAEVQAIYNAGGSGKCATPAPPYIISQPASQSIVVSSNATFSVGAIGTPPLSY